jgi:broad specificity phosphatase PhoE
MSAEKCVNLYFVRHGQTDWNKKGILQGKTNIPLNLIGRNQSDKLAQQLCNIQFEEIYSSPLLRTVETAARINNEKNWDIQLSPWLKERSYGDLEGKNYLESQKIRHEFLQNQPDSWQHNEHGIETDKELEDRIISNLKHIAIAHLAKSTQEKPINDLFVAHSGVLRFLLNHFNFMSYKKMEHYKIEEAALMKVKFDGSSFKVSYIQGFTNRNGN